MYFIELSSPIVRTTSLRSIYKVGDVILIFVTVIGYMLTVSGFIVSFLIY